MKKKLKNCILVFIITVVSILSMAGCSHVAVSGEDEELVVEYAVNAVLNHDKNYIIKLAELPTEAETTTWLYENTQEQTTDNVNQPTSGGVNSQPGADSAVSVNDAFGLNGFTVVASGYEIADKYPDDNEGFSMVAISEYDLLVLKFNVTNNSSNEAVLNMIDADLGYRCMVNGSTRLNVQVTALLNGMNTWNGAFGAGETKEMVLVFQVSEEISANINKINLSIVKDSGTSTAAIKE